MERDTKSSRMAKRLQPEIRGLEPEQYRHSQRQKSGQNRPVPGQIPVQRERERGDKGQGVGLFKDAIRKKVLHDNSGNGNTKPARGGHAKRVGTGKEAGACNRDRMRKTGTVLGYQRTNRVSAVVEVTASGPLGSSVVGKVWKPVHHSIGAGQPFQGHNAASRPGWPASTCAPPRPGAAAREHRHRLLAPPPPFAPPASGPGGRSALAWA